MTNKHAETRLQECYENHKKRVEPPLALHDAILAEAKNNKPSIWRFVSWQYAMAMFVAVILFGWNQNSNPNEVNTHYVVSASYNKNHDVVFYHDIDYRKSHLNQIESVKPTEHHQQYMSALARLKDANKLAGVVESMNDELVIKVCDVGVLRLSKAMVDKLMDNSQTQPMLAGRAIYLVADNEGFITSILKRDDVNQCNT